MAKIDDLSGIPRYLQIARIVEADIRSGRLEPGNPAPSRNFLAETYGVARETAARAHHWLAERGYLVAVAGIGMVVTPPGRWPAEQAGDAS
jgi:DNA-binding GntR family transcriptional regulator